MKEQFLNSLRNALNQHNIENVEEILEKYEKRFTLGYEAGMTDEDIIEALDSIENILNQYESKKNYQLYLDLTMFSDFEIIQKENLKEPYIFDLDIDPFDFDDEEDSVGEYVQIEEESRCISLKTIKECDEELCGALYIHSMTEFDKIYIVTDSCELYIENIKAKEIDIKNVSGDIEIHKIHANNTKIDTNSGDIEIDEMVSDHLMLTSTSGDVSIGKIKVEEVDIAMVSGDLEIDQLEASGGKISSVSGDITYSVGENQTNNVSITTVSGIVEEE